MALGTDRSWDDWVQEYAQSHQHPINRVLHTVGIPMIAFAIFTLPLVWFWQPLWKLDLALFIIGWVFQFVGHAYEKKPPEFLKDWRFLFVGLRWWFAKISGRA